ncbi:MAG: hypothetical protein ACR2RL_23505 [Gammaproteobacteria bacterium]
MSVHGDDAPRTGARIGSGIVLEGYLDAVEARRVYGWVRNPDAISERCSVTVRLGDRELGTVVADRNRVDLEKAGIGDGKYAFQHALDDALDEAQRAEVTAEARSADGSATLQLERFDRTAPRTAGGGPLDWLKPVLTRLAAHQSRSFAKQGETLDNVAAALEALERRLETRPRIADGGDDAAEMEARLSALEGMHLRFDEALLRLREERVAHAGAERPMRRLWRWLLLLALLAAAFALGALVQSQVGVPGLPGV